MSVIVTQVFSIIIGMMLAACGIVMAYVCHLCAHDRIRPNGAVGTRLGFSRYHRLFQQDRYWYPINRYSARMMWPWAVAWIVLGFAEIVLPVDPALKPPTLVVAVLILVAGMITTAVRIYRYAVGLVSGQ